MIPINLFHLYNEVKLYSSRAGGIRNGLQVEMGKAACTLNTDGAMLIIITKTLKTYSIEFNKSAVGITAILF